MLYALICSDKPNGLATRVETQSAHAAFLERLNANGKLAFAGPFLDEEGKPNGSLVVVEAGSAEAARAISAADPYSAAGLFASVHVRPWTWTFNKPAAP